MKKLIILLSIICNTLFATASTSITTSTVSGHWILSGSPYLIYNDINVDIGTILTIDPGVEVIFQGFYSLTVNGDIHAVGTAGNPISFHVYDTTGWSNFQDSAGAWNGIAILQFSSDPDSSTFEYCNVYDVKGSNGPLGINSKSMVIRNCNFFHDNGAVFASIDSTKHMELSYCTIHDNFNGGVGFLGYIINPDHYPTCNIHDCKIYNNTAIGGSFLLLQNLNIVFQNNKIYNNSEYDTIYLPEPIVDVEYCNGLIMGDSIYANTSGYVGAIFCYMGNLDINGNFVCNNKTTVGFTGGTACYSAQGGGGIRVNSEGNTTTNYHSYNYIIRNNIIANNYAALSGGGICVNHATATITNNQIINNTAPEGGGVFIWNAANPAVDPITFDTLAIVKNNIFYNNVDLEFGHDTMNIYVYADSSTRLQFDHNWSQRGFSSGVKVALFPPGSYKLSGDTLTNVIGTDPRLVLPTLTTSVTESALTANFKLQSTSPCINKGDTVGIGTIVGIADYAGNYRISGSAIDIGAYEYGSWPVNVTNCSKPLTEPTINVYPNPAMNLLFISTPESTGTLYIQDILGKTIIEKKVSNKLTYFDINAVPRGVYFAVWNDGNGLKQSAKVVVE